jgi:SMC interacting uncharacterized protein involved in chromosome segregation
MVNSKTKKDCSKHVVIRCEYGHVFTDDPKKIEDGSALKEANYHYSLELNNCVDMTVSTIATVHALQKEEVYEVMLAYLHEIYKSFKKYEKYYQSEDDLIKDAFESYAIVEWKRDGNLYQRNAPQSVFDFLNENA